MEAETHRVLGILKLESDVMDDDKPAEHLRHALSISRALDMLPEQAHCEFAAANAGIDSPDGSAAHLNNAAAAFRKLDMPYWLKRAKAKLAELSPDAA